MPELPEVEAARRAIEEHCLGKKIVKSIIADDSKVVDGVSHKDFEASLNGKTIVAAHRKGKNMWLQLNSPPFPSFQFGMTGAIYIKGVAVTNYKRSSVKDTDEWPSKYSKFFVELNDGLELSFTDKRRFARVRLLDNPVAVPPISELGPDALLEPMAVDEFHKLLSKKNLGIKALLLDQGFISGIGNWVADEVLYQAKIHPLQSASSMSIEVCGTLLNCINEVIQFAVQVDADCGSFPRQWLFHYRWGKKPGKVKGKKIEFINAGGRTTAYVPELQKLGGAQAAKEASKPQKSSAKNTKNSKKGVGSDDNDDDEPESEEDAKTRKSKVIGGKKAARGTNAPVKAKPKKSPNVAGDDSNDDNDGDYGDEDPKKNGNKKLTARSMPKGSCKDDSGIEFKKDTGKNSARKRKPVESDDDKNYDGNQKNGKEAKAQKAPKEKVDTSQTRRLTRKKV
ncbi:formamidopyrimidine-DNA glycosylase isoform X2 [Coffea eugenioides]|uniref:Formamidopyrimidine-DNA glycosylase-like isoform X2 n=1 Tax=Coffea arabica TaxID=13443 RepID=A0A6P6XG30_COFAR|nr:formamidopyrimidine-DNA glycosylase-like isoform X2 [Coffea arabica]XP_027167609.1 formamidopyrimidine-DNA glycosylase isoform X2 [Coffea eugenioides]